MIQWALDLYAKHTFILATVGYALPLVTNVIIFTVRTIKDYQKDIVDRAASAKAASGYNYYHPSLTVGVLVWRFLGTVLPLMNVISMFRNVPHIFSFISRIFEGIWKVLEIPLVPPTKK